MPLLLSPFRLSSSAVFLLAPLSFYFPLSVYLPFPLPLLVFLPFLRFFDGVFPFSSSLPCSGLFFRYFGCGYSSLPGGLLLLRFPQSLFLRFCSECSSPFAVDSFFVLTSCLYFVIFLLHCRSAVFRLVLLSLPSCYPQSWWLLACAVSSLPSPSWVFSAVLVTLLQGCLSSVCLCGRFLFGSSGFVFSAADGGGIVASSVSIPGDILYKVVLAGFSIASFAFWFLSYVSFGFFLLRCAVMVLLISVVTAPAASP